jgi:quercetin dioxygenase-like cupin family protein
MKPTTKFVAATFFALPASLASVLAQEGLKRTPLGTTDFPPGYQTVMGVAQIAPGTCAGHHTHPGIESSYIVEGEILIKIDGGQDQQLKAGDSFQIAAGIPHDGCTTGGAKLVTVHVIEKGKPLGSPAP